MDSPLKWHGGKHYLAKWIIEHFPRRPDKGFAHKHFVETHFGAGAVLFTLPPEGVSEVVNDIHGGLTNFWRVLRDPVAREKMIERLQLTPFSKLEWEESAMRMTPEGDLDHLAAACFFVRCRQSRQALMKDFATLSKTRTRGGMNEQISAWMGAIDGLKDASERLAKVVVFSADAIDIILQEDSPDTLFYVDPPYVKGTRNAQDCYEFEMTDDQHEKLLEVLAGIEGKFILSGYPNPIYDTWAQSFGWHCRSKKIDNKASGAKVKGIKVETIWMNFQPATEETLFDS